MLIYMNYQYKKGFHVKVCLKTVTLKSLPMTTKSLEKWFRVIRKLINSQKLMYYLLNFRARSGLNIYLGSLKTDINLK